MRSILFVLLGVLASACRGGGGGGHVMSTCNYVGGSENCIDTGGCQNPTNSIDSDLTTFAQLSSTAGSTISASRGTGGAQFPAGSNAGVFLTLPNGFTATDVTLSTLLGSSVSPVETATGPTLTITPTNGDPAVDYVSFNTTAPFNGVQLTINTTNSADTLVYEFCGSAVVR